MMNTLTRDYAGHWLPRIPPHAGYTLAEPLDADDDENAADITDDELEDERSPS